MRVASVLHAGLFVVLCHASWRADAQEVTPILGVESSPPVVTGLEPGLTPWAVLSGVTVRKHQHRTVPHFAAAQLALHRKVQRFRGYMVAMGAEKLQSRFLLQPTTGCEPCNQVHSEKVIEVSMKAPVEYADEAVVVEGIFTLMHDDDEGLYYRLEQAVIFSH